MNFDNFSKKWFLFLFGTLVVIIVGRFLRQQPLFGSPKGDEWVLALIYIQLSIVALTSLFYLIDQVEKLLKEQPNLKQTDRIKSFVSIQFAKQNWRYFTAGGIVGLAVHVASLMITK